MPDRAPTVAIAVLTYRRPQDLQDVVPAVLDQIAGSGLDATLLVIDNDPDGAAMAAALEQPADAVRFVHEPAPGIASARNRALDEADGTDLLVFLDDDERPEPGWLAELVSTWQRTRAAAVVGPVISAYPHEPDPWITAGRFFDRRRLATGTEISTAATNNLLLDLRQIDRLGVRFDPALGATGGSDTLFTRQLHQRGGRMVWCDEARVIDVVPPARLTRRWVLQRALRTGNSWSRISLALEDRRARRTWRRLALTAQGSMRVVGGVVRLLAGLLTRSLPHRARGARTLARGLGMASGAWGYTFAEYRRRGT